MVQNQPPADRPDHVPPAKIDPWQVLSQLIAGVLLYAGIGWLIDRWLETRVFVAIGICLGAGLGIYMVYKRTTVPPASADEPRTRNH